MELTVLLPTLNEAGNVAAIVPALRRALAPLGLAYEILVVDGHSTDATRAVALSLGCRIHEQIDPGYAAALREGFQRARGRFVLVMDADGSHHPDDVPALLARRRDAAVVIASRYVPGGRTRAGAWRDLLSRILNFVYRTALLLPVRDCSSGFRLYWKSALDGIEIRARHFEVQQEVLVKILSKGYRVLEVPFEYRPRGEGVSKARVVRFGFTLLAMLFKLIPVRFG